MKRKYTVKAWDGLMEWNSDYYEFEAESDEEAIKIADDWFNTEYLPDVLNDPQSYDDYPNEEDYDSEDEYEYAVAEAQDTLREELMWEFVVEN